MHAKCMPFLASVRGDCSWIVADQIHRTGVQRQHDPRPNPPEHHEEGRLSFFLRRLALLKKWLLCGCFWSKASTGTTSKISVRATYIQQAVVAKCGGEVGEARDRVDIDMKRNIVRQCATSATCAYE